MKLQVNFVTLSVHLVIFSLQVFGLGHTLYRYLTVGLSGKIPAHILSNGFLFKYFTYWTLIIQTIVFAMSLVVDFMAVSSVRNRLIVVRDILFYSVAIPCGGVVTTSFWGLYFADRSLVIPKEAVGMYPLWKNHILHTLPTVAVIVENLLIDHKRREKKGGVLVYLLFVLSYLGYVHFIGYFRNDWVYPILARMNDLQRFGFLLLNVSSGLFFYYLGGLMYDIVWSNRITSLPTKSKHIE